MLKEGENKGEYVRKVYEETRQFTEKLLRENEDLRKTMALILGEKKQVEVQLAGIRAEYERHREDRFRLQQQLAAIEEKNQRFYKEYEEIQQQNSNLANLYVASYRLHGTLDRHEVLTTIEEIVINLVGSEELGIFVRDPKTTALSLVASHGIDAAGFQRIPLGSGIIGHVAEAGEIYVTGEQDGLDRTTGEANLSACVPLKVNGKTIGAIAIFRLLTQKTGFEELDRELFNLLATHAATALYCAGIYALSTAEVGAPA
jgi:nitrate/nitrite-specific signal transduction histidine kinase